MADFSVGWKFDNRKFASAKVHAAAVRGVHDATEELLTVANQRVPHDKGTLQRSGTASFDDTKISGAVAYDTPYAVRQHEDTSLHHDDARRTKWLQLALQENAPKLRKHIAAQIKAAIEGGG